MFDHKAEARPQTGLDRRDRHATHAATSPDTWQSRSMSAGRSLAASLRGSKTALLSLGLGLIAWEALGWWAGLRFLPPFSGVVQAAVLLVTSGQILPHLAGSLLSLVAGYGLAVALGVLAGLLMGRYRTVEYLFNPYLTVLLATPKIVLVPVMYALFGLSRMVQVAVVFLSAVFIVVLNTMRAVQHVDPAYAEMARAFGAKDKQLFWKVLLPGAAPLTLAGLRLAVGRAVKGMIKGEMYITLFGLGALLRTYGSRFDSEKVFAVLLIVVGTALVCTFAIRSLERRLLHWTEPGHE